MVSTLPSYTVTVEFLDNFIVKETDKLIYLVDYISCDLISNQTRIRTAIQIRRKAKMWNFTRSLAIWENGKMGILESSHTLSFFIIISWILCAAGSFFGRLTRVPWFQVAPTIELVEYPALQNLRTLILDTCSLHNNFGLLHHCLRNSPNLEKLTVQYCKVLHFFYISLILQNFSIYLVTSNLHKSFNLWWKGFRWFHWRGRQY